MYNSIGKNLKTEIYVKYRIAFLSLLFHIAGLSVLAQEPVANKQVSTPNSTYSESLPYTPQTIASVAKTKKIRKAKLASQDSGLSVDSAFDASSVSIPVSIFDRGGQFVRGLTKNEIEVFIDDQKQEILDFSSDDKPVEVVFLVDTSPSTLYSMDEIQKFLIASIREFKPQDKISIVKFDGKLKVLIDSSSDKDAVIKSIRKLSFGNGTSLYDAVAQLSENKVIDGGPKAVVLVTDGVDTTSLNSDYNSSVLSVQKGDSTFFPIYLDTFQANVTAVTNSRQYPILIPGLGTLSNGPPVMKEDYDVGKIYLTDLLNLTGGRAFLFSPITRGATVPTPNISHEIRLRYTATIKKPISTQAGQIKRIKVRVARPNLTVLTKSRLATAN